jgi:hypothetical protein
LIGERRKVMLGSSGTRSKYLGFQIGFCLLAKANFGKLMLVFKSKLINWVTCKISLVGQILIANQILFANIWCITTCWTPNLCMCA